jgi:hypothetical protein
MIVVRMCGGPLPPWRGGAFVRRIPHGVVFDWFGIGFWKKR